jgi:glyceraldehyde-3-phosphate dehydrogenase/erythrose-4-phosphate dehydrogenase
MPIEKIDENSISVNGKVIRVFSEKNPADIKWGEAGA